MKRMSINKKTGRYLREIGLAEHGSEAYQFLLILGSNMTNQICEATGPPYSKIHDVLTSLEQKGWMEAESGRPKGYYPKPPLKRWKPLDLTQKDFGR